VNAAGELPGSGPEVAILAADLRKTYSSPRGDVEAVRGVAFTVDRGEFFGVLGPNGAGKSTTIGMLTTLVRPSSGRAEVLGYDVVRRPEEVKRRIGVVSQSNTLDRKLTVAENLEFRARYFGQPGRVARRRAAELLDLLDLGRRGGALVHELSGGQARRLMIGRALVHRPELLFLDEPTTGIDPQARANLWDVFRMLHAQGVTIVLTTHYLDEAEQLCERMAVIDEGRVLSVDDLSGLTRLANAETVVTAVFDGAAPGSELLSSGLGGRRFEVDGPQVRVFAARSDGVLADLVRVGAAAGRSVRDATTERPSLDHVFLALTGKEYRE
jgi:daunorubicin resistance ABC transporter ATP-binding subunit